MRGEATMKATAELLSKNEQYLSELLSYSADRLNKEPELLKEDQNRIQRQLEETAFRNYKAFVSTAECIQKVGDGLSEIGEELSSIRERIPAIEKNSSRYESVLSEHLQEQGQNKQLLSNCSQVLEILEVAQLMETCIRHGNYDEALDLEAFINKLTVLHPNVKVIQVLQAESNKLSMTMQRQLFKRLRANLQLPECLRIVGYLRRMGGFTENGLREEYLNCRDLWFQNLVNDLSKIDHYSYIKRLTDYHRVHIFDIIMQYRAIFSDDKSLKASAAAKKRSRENLGKLENAMSDKDAVTSYADLLHVWSSKRIDLYLRELRAHLPFVHEGANLSSVFEHCMYCGMSLGRIGLDFRCLLVPLFEEAVFSLFTKHTKNALSIFASMLASYKWPKVNNSSNVEGPTATSTTSSSGSGLAKESESSAGPPYSLMQHTPLAILTNSVSNTFNELRHCAPRAMASQLTCSLETFLQEVARTLKWYGIASDLDEAERASFRTLCSQYCDTLVPYLLNSFERIYPENNQESHGVKTLIKQLML
jgi:hypothetical protein